MFKAIELGQTFDKKDFKAAEPQNRADLLALQREFREAGIATLIIVSGVEGSGKGDVVDNLNKWFDSRGIETHAFWDETDEERERPEYWRFWKRMPARGDIAVMFGGWYWGPIHDHAGGEIDDAQLDEHTSRIRELERMLELDGLLIIKLWFHLSESSFHRHMKKRKEVNRHVGQLSGEGKPIEMYERFLVSAERAIRHTDTSDCPWQLVEADDRWYRDMSVMNALKNTLSQRLEQHRVPASRAVYQAPIANAGEDTVTVLDAVDNESAMTKDEYKEALNHHQELLSKLAWRAYDAKRSTVIVFEGWDAAGKGGAIRRITTAMDARLYRVNSVAAPTDEEKAHHYLWRFWRRIPRAGYMSIYDRSWYGRTLVERVEGFAQTNEWTRAYQEINAFEEELTDSGITVLKFWLHISPEEQLARFEERQQSPWKQHKITEEDWRNRDKWNDYVQAVNEMVIRTSTTNAPWYIVPANDKYTARVDVLKHVCEELENTLSHK